MIPKAKRTDAGYRIYDEKEVHALRFIKRSRELGFSIKEIKKLLRLWRNRSRASSEVKALAHAHIKELELKITELTAMRDPLKHLVRNCHGDARPDCPILEELSHG